MTAINLVAVIGLGSIALRHRRNLKQLYPQATILAMSASGRITSNPVEYADKVVPNLETLIAAKPYLVIIASPSSLHAKQATLLIEAGIPSLIEKPVTATFSDAEMLNQVAANNLTPISIGYCLRYLSSALVMKSLLQDQRIGKIYNVHADVGQYLLEWRPSSNYLESVSANASLGGGALLELSHELDYVQWLLGELSLEYAQLRNSSELNLEVEEIADLVLSTQTGTVCTIHLDFLQKKAHRHCHFIGSTGRLNWDLLNNTITLHSAAGDEILYSAPDWDKNQMYLAMIADFVNQIEGKEHTCIKLKQAVCTIQLIEQIKRHATRGITQ